MKGILRLCRSLAR